MEDHKAMVKTRFKLCTFNIEWETYHVTTTCQRGKHRIWFMTIATFYKPSSQTYQ